jgi:hypothetical protein
MIGFEVTNGSGAKGRAKATKVMKRVLGIDSLSAEPFEIEYVGKAAMVAATGDSDAKPMFIGYIPKAKARALKTALRAADRGLRLTAPAAGLY